MRRAQQSDGGRRTMHTLTAGPNMGNILPRESHVYEIPRSDSLWVQGYFASGSLDSIHAT